MSSVAKPAIEASTTRRLAWLNAVGGSAVLASYLVRLGDVAHIELGPEDVRRMSRSSGARAIGLGLVKQSTANPLEVSRGVHAELDALEQVLPEGMVVNVGFDQADPAFQARDDQPIDLGHVGGDQLLDRREFVAVGHGA